MKFPFQIIFRRTVDFLLVSKAVFCDYPLDRFHRYNDILLQNYLNFLVAIIQSALLRRLILTAEGEIAEKRSPAEVEN